MRHALGLVEPNPAFNKPVFEAENMFTDHLLAPYGTYLVIHDKKLNKLKCFFRLTRTQDL